MAAIGDPKGFPGFKGGKELRRELLSGLDLALSLGSNSKENSRKETAFCRSFIICTGSTSETSIEMHSPSDDSTHGAKRAVFWRRHFR